MCSADKGDQIRGGVSSCWPCKCQFPEGPKQRRRVNDFYRQRGNLKRCSLSPHFRRDSVKLYLEAGEKVQRGDLFFVRGLVNYVPAVP